MRGDTGSNHQFTRRPQRNRGSDWVKLLLVLLLVGAALLCADAVFAPWGFYLGGHFHLWPGWQGWGTLHSASAGGDYKLYVRFTPTPSGPPYLSKSVKGDAILCTPRGERYHLRLGGGMPKKLALNTVGQPLRLYANNYSGLKQFSGDFRPQVDLWGVWGPTGPMMEDRGSIAKAFLPDGTLRPKNDPGRFKSTENIHVNFEEASAFALWPGCNAK